MNAPTPHPVWPDDYESWSGSFDDLVATAAKIIAILEPSVKPLTARTARNYQQAGVLGTGLRQGRRSVFVFQDLQALVLAKGLMRRAWPLTAAASLINSSPDSAHDIMYVSSANTPPPVSAATLLRTHLPPPSARPNTAQRTIAELMAASGLPGTVRPPPGLIGRPASPVGRAIKVVDVDPACHVHLDELSISMMPPSRRRAMTDRLRALADQLANTAPNPLIPKY